MWAIVIYIYKHNPPSVSWNTIFKLYRYKETICLLDEINITFAYCKYQLAEWLRLDLIKTCFFSLFPFLFIFYLLMLMFAFKNTEVFQRLTATTAKHIMPGLILINNLLIVFFKNLFDFWQILHICSLTFWEDW